jgi:hypothetical protein
MLKHLDSGEGATRPPPPPTSTDTRARTRYALKQRSSASPILQRHHQAVGQGRARFRRHFQLSVPAARIQID